jgi:hypothetical protein
MTILDPQTETSALNPMDRIVDAFADLVAVLTHHRRCRSPFESAADGQSVERLVPSSRVAGQLATRCAPLLGGKVRVFSAVCAGRVDALDAIPQGDRLNVAFEAMTECAAVCGRLEGEVGSAVRFNRAAGALPRLRSDAASLAALLRPLCPPAQEAA